MIVSWMTTNQCNLFCRHCYQDAGERLESELSTVEAERLIDSIARCGFRILIFSGGEPLLREDIFHLVRYAAGQGLRPVFGTNGTLITEKTAYRLKESGAAAMGISLDSLNQEEHNRFRGSEDAFQRTLEGIGHCRKANLPFQLHTTAMDWNREEILAITDFAVEQGAAAHYIFFLIPVGRGVYLEDTALEVLENERLLGAIMEKQTQVGIEIKPTCAPQFMRIASEKEIRVRFSRGCVAGLPYCIVSPGGKVRPCAYMTGVAGDVREQDFQEIWEESPVFQTLRTRQYGGACGKCDYEPVCGGCRARAGYYHDGDFMAADSCCAYGNKLVGGEE